MTGDPRFTLTLDNSELSEWLNYKLRRTQIPISQLSDETGISRPTIYSLLKGKKTLSIYTLLKLTDYFNCNLYID